MPEIKRLYEINGYTDVINSDTYSCFHSIDHVAIAIIVQPDI